MELCIGVSGIVENKLLYVWKKCVCCKIMINLFEFF